VLGLGGLVISLLLACALIAATRRQTAHFRSLVTSSTDLVLVFGSDGCRYVSRSVTELLGRPERELLGDGILESLDADERARLQATIDRGRPHELVIRLRDKFGAWRHLEARVTDLRGDRHVRGVVLNARDITERVGLEEELIRQAFHDSLTGLANRGLFRDRVDQALARATRSGAELAVLFIDLSGLKEVNDSVGHEAGDELLKEVAQRFSRLTRPSDTLARLGGDEFALLLEETDEPGAVRVARRLLERLSEPLRIGDRDVAASASVGIVVDRGGSAGGEDLLRHADVAMYAAKQDGRGRCEVFRHEMAEEVFDQLELERQLRQAVRDGEFVLYYQPEIELETGATVGAEALLRWRSPERGLVMPAHFIPMAESTELIVPLGAWVVEEACRQAARWQRDGLLRDGFVTWVNLSAKQLAAGGVSEVVRNALASSGLSPGSLGLEVTESTIVEAGTEGERARAQLQDLRDMGVRIAIDDFGTGFSSHRQLRQLPADVIKIDRSFLQGIEQDPKDAAITENLVRLSQAIGVVTVAEGIETEGQLARLRKLGCELGQGFLFSRPVPAADMTELLATGASLLSPREAA
jgi:diguanylate cyclase (GGDEF)-like protein/PAS domain S-box-containing protein